jgi:hypothetical protein
MFSANRFEASLVRHPVVGFSLGGICYIAGYAPNPGRWRALVERCRCAGNAQRADNLRHYDRRNGYRVFFAQVLPSVAGEGVRAWLLVRLGCDWRNAVTSVVIDRGVGLCLLVAMGFVILLLPSSLTALGGYRDTALVVYGALLLAGAFGLVFAPTIVLPLARWRYSRWFATLAVDVRRVLLGPHGAAILASGCVIHVLTIVVIWSLGRAQGLELPLSDAAVLLLVMVGVTLVPISISGWGLRELAVVSLLGHHGVAPEKALLFSVCFGLTLAVGSLPGAVAWLLYSFAPSRHSAEHGG